MQGECRVGCRVRIDRVDVLQIASRCVKVLHDQADLCLVELKCRVFRAHLIAIAHCTALPVHHLDSLARRWDRQYVTHSGRCLAMYL
jgi:hypothetical protein